MSGKGQRFPGIGPPPIFWSLKVSLGTVLAPLGVSFSLLVCYNERILRIKIQSKLTCLPSWTHLIPISLCCVLGLCHPFKSCALPPPLLFQYEYPGKRQPSTSEGGAGTDRLQRNQFCHQTSSLWDGKKINVCCLSHPVYGAFSWQLAKEYRDHIPELGKGCLDANLKHF